MTAEAEREEEKTGEMDGLIYLNLFNELLVL